jgi:hypothetical protein
VINKATITVDSKVIAAMKLFVGGYSVSAIDGINVEIDKHESRLVATNGHVLVFYYIPQGNDLSAPLRDAIIPTNILTDIKPKTGRVDVTIELEREKDRAVPKNVILHFGISEVKGSLLNRKFPDWRKIIPTEVSGEVAQFDPDYIALFSKAWHILNGKRKSSTPPRVLIGHNGLGAAFVDIDDENFFGFLMPLRYAEKNLQRIKELPKWVASQVKKDSET